MTTYEKLYAEDGAYLGLIFRQDGWWFAEDRLCTGRRFPTEADARAWLAKRYRMQERAA